jgi:hypothetical protein
MEPTAYIWSASDKHSFLTTVLRHAQTVTKEEAGVVFLRQLELEHATSIAPMTVLEAIMGRLRKWVDQVFVLTAVSTLDSVGSSSRFPPSEAEDPLRLGCLNGSTSGRK